MFRVFCFSEGIAASHWRGDKSPSWTAAKTLLEALLSPPHSLGSHMAIFTDAVWNDTRAQTVVVHKAHYFQCFP